MTTRQRLCERAGCMNHLTGRQKRYCSNACRATAEHAKKHALAESVALETVRQQVAPVVLEVLTESVKEQLKVLTEMLPEALAALRKNLDSKDEAEVRHAAGLILRYTVGNTSVAPAGADSGQAPIQINFGVPQQGEDTSDADGSVLELDEVEPVDDTRECLECHLWKPAAEFVGNSYRCQSCHDEMLDEVRKSHPGLLPSVS